MKLVCFLINRGRLYIVIIYFQVVTTITQITEENVLKERLWRQRRF